MPDRAERPLQARARPRAVDGRPMPDYRRHGLSVAFARLNTVCPITADIAPLRAHLPMPMVDTLAFYEQFHCRGEKSS
jgi:hypothetical protein